ncbi:hypothetical protein D3C86_1664150 [compost metagenome]
MTGIQVFIFHPGEFKLSTEFFFKNHNADLEFTRHNEWFRCFSGKTCVYGNGETELEDIQAYFTAQLNGSSELFRFKCNFSGYIQVSPKFSTQRPEFFIEFEFRTGTGSDP